MYFHEIEGGTRERNGESDNTTHSERFRRFQTTQLQMKLDSLFYTLSLWPEHRELSREPLASVAFLIIVIIVK